MQTSTLTVGITGGIGSGKSLVCKIFKALNIPVYYADDRAKWLQTNDIGLVEAIKDVFGENAYNDQGVFDKAFIANQVFNDKAKLQLLNDLVHPKVAQDFYQWQQIYTLAPYVVKEAALLFETGSYQSLHKVINVNAPTELRIRRVLLRDQQRSKEQVLSIIARQWNDQQRAKLADFTIENNENSHIVPKVLAIHSRLLQSKQ